jgi:uncharacterized protein YoxC
MGKRNRIKIEKLTTKITNWMGTTQSIIFHTIFFIGMFLLIPLGVSSDQVMLILTTAVSLEAIYLALFIQMTVNRNTESLQEVEKDIEEIQEDVEGVEGDISEIQDDVEDLGQEVEDISEDVEDISTIPPSQNTQLQNQLETISQVLQKLQKDLAEIKNSNQRQTTAS